MVVVEATQIQINSLVIVQGYLDHANKLVVALGLIDQMQDKEWAQLAFSLQMMRAIATFLKHNYRP